MSPRPRLTSDEDILEATARAVSRVGPLKLTLSDVATEAGIAPATLVQRFGSKRALLLAFARQGSELLRDEGRRSGPRLEALVASCLSITRLVDSPEALSNHLAFLQMDLNDDEFRTLADEAAQKAVDQIRAFLDEAVAASELLPCDTRRLARTVHAVVGGSLINWAIRREGTVRTWLRRDLETLLAPYREARREP